MPQIPSIPAPALPTTAITPVDEVAAQVDVGHAATGSTRTKQRKWPKRLVLLTCVVLLGLAGATFGKGFYEQYQENKDASAGEAEVAPPVARTPEGTPVGGVIDDARNVVDDINTNDGEAEILGEMGLDPAGNILPTDARSFRMNFDYGDGDVFEIAVDWPTMNSIYTSPETEVRTIEGRSYARSAAAGEWTESVPSEAFADLKVFSTDIAISDRNLPFAVEATPTVHGGGRYVIDTAAFAAGDPEYWTAWSLFLTDVERVPVAGETATLDVVGLADGVLQSAIVTFLPTRETMSYTLSAWSAAPLVVTLD